MVDTRQSIKKQGKVILFEVIQMFFTICTLDGHFMMTSLVAFVSTTNLPIYTLCTRNCENNLANYNRIADSHKNITFNQKIALIVIDKIVYLYHVPLLISDDQVHRKKGNKYTKSAGSDKHRGKRNGLNETTNVYNNICL